MTDKEKNIIDGIMLADGHLERLKVSSRITYGCKFKETLEDIEKCLPNLSFSNKWQSQKTDCWHFKSKSYYDLNSIQKRWYVDNVKTVPDNLILTIECLYWWFIGDGYRRDYSVVFCTDAFNYTDKTFLISSFKNIGFTDVHLTKNGKRIYIGGSEVQKFLDLIQNNIEISVQYKYKFSEKWKIRKKK